MKVNKEAIADEGLIALLTATIQAYHVKQANFIWSDDKNAVSIQLDLFRKPEEVKS